MSSEQEPAGFNGGYNPDGTWRWHVFNPNASPLEKKQVELDCMTRLKRIQEERTAHWRSISEQVDAMPKDWSLAWSSPHGCWQVTGTNGWGSDDYTFGVIGSGSSPTAAIQSALATGVRMDE